MGTRIPSLVLLVAMGVSSIGLTALAGESDTYYHASSGVRVDSSCFRAGSSEELIAQQKAADIAIAHTLSELSNTCGKGTVPELGGLVDAVSSALGLIVIRCEPIGLSRPEWEIAIRRARSNTVHLGSRLIDGKITFHSPVFQILRNSSDDIDHRSFRMLLTHELLHVVRANNFEKTRPGASSKPQAGHVRSEIENLNCSDLDRVTLDLTYFLQGFCIAAEGDANNQWQLLSKLASKCPNNPRQVLEVCKRTLARYPRATGEVFDPEADWIGMSDRDAERFCTREIYFE